jgi:hypothetical protein
VTQETLFSFFSRYETGLSKNVEMTIRQWHEKHSSYYYSTGTIFFCEGREKGRLIKTLIEKGVIRAYEIKPDEVFLIPEEDKTAFFSFLDKTGIQYFHKVPEREMPEIPDPVSAENILP